MKNCSVIRGYRHELDGRKVVVRELRDIIVREHRDFCSVDAIEFLFRRHVCARVSVQKSGFVGRDLWSMHATSASDLRDASVAN